MTTLFGRILILAQLSACSADGPLDWAPPQNGEVDETPDWAGEPPGFQRLASQSWTALPGDWGPSRWGSTYGTQLTGAETRIASDSTTPFGGASVLQGYYPEGALNGYGAGRTGYQFGSPPTEVFVGMWAKVDADFISHPFQLKWHFLWLDGTDDVLWIDWRHRFEGNVPDRGLDEISNLRLRFQGPGWGIDELQPQNVQPDLVEFPRGEWVRIELLADLGDPGTPTGRVRLWQDGVLIVDLPDFRFPAGARGFNRFYHEGVYGGAGFPHPQPQSWYVAYTYISVPGGG